MAKFRTHFELNQKDINHIELALSNRVGELTRRVFEVGQVPANARNPQETQQYLEEIGSIRQLLGRIHGQKIWYEPKHYVPRG